MSRESLGCEIWKAEGEVLFALEYISDIWQFDVFVGERTRAVQEIILVWLAVRLYRFERRQLCRMVAAKNGLAWVDWFILRLTEGRVKYMEKSWGRKRELYRFDAYFFLGWNFSDIVNKLWDEVGWGFGLLDWIDFAWVFEIVNHAKIGVIHILAAPVDEISAVHEVAVGV